MHLSEGTSDLDEKLRLVRLLQNDPLFPGDCGELVGLIGRPTASDTTHRTTMSDICKHFFGVEGDYYKASNEHMGFVRRLIRKTREELGAASKRPEAKEAAYRIHFEKGNRATGVRLSFRPKYPQRTKRGGKTDGERSVASPVQALFGEGTLEGIVQMVSSGQRAGMRQSSKLGLEVILRLFLKDTLAGTVEVVDATVYSTEKQNAPTTSSQLISAL